MEGMQKLTTIWKSKDITIETKIELYRVLSLSITTYGLWILDTQEERRT